MDNIYENAIKNIKSSLYDVMIIEQDNLNSLENKMLVSAEEEKEILKEKIALKKETLNNLRTNTQELEKNLEVLDNFDNELINNKEEIEEPVNNSIEDIEIKEQENEEPENDSIEDTEIKEQEIEEPENDSIEDTESKEQEKEEPVNEPIEDTESKEQEEKEESENDNIKDIDIPIVNNSSESQDQNTEEVNNESKYRFIKNTNNPVKAILVTKEQEEKLSQSLEKQEYIQVVKENLKDLKPFDSNDLEQIRNQDMIENQEFQKELEKQIQKNIEAGVDKERQIEDLMVKANIYTNEGESDKAEIIYNKINELQNGSELKENPVMVKAA